MTIKKDSEPNEKPHVEPPLDYHDEPPPTVLANTSGEGDDPEPLRRGEAPATAEKKKEDDQDEDENEGEGNRSADQRYREGVQKHLGTHDVEQEAKEAEEALDDEEQRKQLEEAEERGRAGPLP